METIEKVKSPNWGGNRKNAGRKSKYGEKTKVLTFRVPISKVDEIKSAVRYIVDQPKQEF